MVAVQDFLDNLSAGPRTTRVKELLERVNQRGREMADPSQSGLRDAVLASVQQDGSNLPSGPNRGPLGALTTTPSGVLSPVPGAQLSNSFGAPRSGGRRHQGIDIMADLGTPIVAPVDGIAERGGYWNNTGGNSLGIRDATGNWHYFTHMNEPSHIQPGQYVGAGTVIGYVGQTGNARGTSPHLHYSINEGRENVINAYDFLTGGRN